ncbi:hypothetical protein O181_055678 [Austropuccinia psidii MF-1]|uniref:Uncharacterized protein n=1 Tax=Austropuccinia psidii MF-1 TaxID=1389203 RepID=A0A9Q3HSQ3_9BASI|nr:hypothetical protein [Austropuccinia psidii MF-1]
MANHRFPDNPRILWSSIKKGGRFGLEACVDEPPTSDATSGHSNLTGSRMRGVQQLNNTTGSWANIGGPIHTQGNSIEVAPGFPILVTRKDGRLGKLKRNLVVQDDIDTYEIDGEELEVITPIQKTGIHSTFPSLAQVNTTINKVIRYPKPPQTSPTSPTRPSTLASKSTNLKPPIDRTSRDPMYPDPE